MSRGSMSAGQPSQRHVRVQAEVHLRDAAVYRRLTLLYPSTLASRLGDPCPYFPPHRRCSIHQECSEAGGGGVLPRDVDCFRNTCMEPKMGSVAPAAPAWMAWFRGVYLSGWSALTWTPTGGMPHTPQVGQLRA